MQHKQQHLQRLHRRRRAPDRRGPHHARSARDRGRQRGRPADRRGAQPAARAVPRRAARSAVRRRAQHHVGPEPAADRRRVRRVGQPGAASSSTATSAAYCPYTNIRAQPYPAILVKTSYNDSQVMYWEPAKYVAKLRAHKTDAQPAAVLHQHGRRPRRRVRPLRRAARARLRFRVPAQPARRRAGRPVGVSRLEQPGAADL